MANAGAPQAAILEPLPPHARYLVFGLSTGRDPREGLARARSFSIGSRDVLGLGAPLVAALGATIDGLRAFPAMTGPGVSFPSTQGALWAYLPGDDRGEILDRARGLHAALGGAFTLDEEVEGFFYAGGRDLSGFVDGTENPKGDAAVAAAIVEGRGAGLDGGSFVAAQRYRHDLVGLAALAPPAQDAVIGRARATDVELADAPASSHVKRTAQESFDPPAFMLRRSLPWGGAGEHGLYFVAFGADLDRFERVLARMAGRDDGTVDALLRFTRALSGGYYFCPPRAADGGIDLSRVGLRAPG
jgi:putative iron-dependent peroxidase